MYAHEQNDLLLLRTYMIYVIIRNMITCIQLYVSECTLIDYCKKEIRLQDITTSV